MKSQLEIGKEYALGKYLGPGWLICFETGKAYRANYLLFERDGRKARLPYKAGELAEVIRKLEGPL